MRLGKVLRNNVTCDYYFKVIAKYPEDAEIVRRHLIKWYHLKEKDHE